MLIEVYADTRRLGVCRSCHAPIEWATVVKSGKAMLFNAPLVPVRTQPALVGSAIDVIDTTRTIVHFVTCPQAKDWRRR